VAAWVAKRRRRKESTMKPPRIATRSGWLAERTDLLKLEKHLTRLRDDVSRRRQALPWVKVERPYVFDGAHGRRTLAELFDGKSQLVVYHFMFGPEWEAGCPSCSFAADHFDGMVVHLAHRDVKFVAVSRAPFAKLAQFEKRMGWRFEWFSSHGSAFNFDHRVSFTPEEIAQGAVEYNYAKAPFPADEAPGISVFARDDAGAVYHTYSTFARGCETLLGTYGLLDLVPKGRDEASLAFTMAWVRHHDRYDEHYVVDPRANFVAPLAERAQ
jgi:predicted dithiol-disulfide oxidoreductase (DUF899 family)